MAVGTAGESRLKKPSYFFAPNVSLSCHLSQITEYIIMALFFKAPAVNDHSFIRPTGQREERILNRTLFSIIAIVMTLMIMSACGGDGSSGAVDEQADIEYNGITDPAPLDRNNAGEIIQAALFSGYLAMGPNFSQDNAGINDNAPGLSLLPILEDLAWEIEDQFLENLSHSKTMAGNCPENPGYASYTVTENVSDRTFSGEMAFYNFCNDYVILNGQAKIEGQFERDRDAFGRFTLTFSWLKASSGNRSYTLNGGIIIVLGNPASTATMNLALKDNKTGTIYKLQDFEVVITRETGYIEYEMSGKILSSGLRMRKP